MLPIHHFLMQSGGFGVESVANAEVNKTVVGQVSG